VNAFQELQLTTQLLSAVPPFLMSLNTALILGIGGLRVIEGHLTMGMLVAFQSLMFAFLSPVNKLVTLGGQLQEVKGDMNRLDDVLRAARDPGAQDDAPPAPASAGATAAGAADAVTIGPRLEGYLELVGVSFGYSRLEPPLISNFDLSLKPGARIALVGGSGSGKSTVAKLVAGLYEPWSGQILFDGRPRPEVPRAVLIASVAVVDQDISMFEGTIRDNLTMWDKTVPDSDLVAAARDACIHEDVMDRAGGYGASLEEGGRNFSGGQRQRMEIARALVGDPTVLILDEATSALDPESEALVNANLLRIARGRTMIVVSHRLSSLTECDQILVLEKGGVMDIAPHRVLLERCAVYRQLWAQQNRHLDSQGPRHAIAPTLVTGA